MTKFNKFCQGAWFYHIETLCKYLISVAESCDQFHGPAEQHSSLSFFIFLAVKDTFGVKGMEPLSFALIAQKMFIFPYCYWFRYD